MKSGDATLACPLCGTSASVFCEATELGDYLLCPECDLKFLDPARRLGPEEERKRYALHHNDVDDPRYRAFLRPVVDEVLRRVPVGGKGLDFGAGPGPAAARMLEESGYSIRLFDPIFHPDDEALFGKYDFVLTTEVVEHLHRPGDVFTQFRRMLNPGGLLVVMTSLTDGIDDFKKWYYRRDPTHVGFYSSRTARWIAERYGFKAEILPPRIFVLEAVAGTMEAVAK